MQCNWSPIGRPQQLKVVGVVALELRRKQGQVSLGERASRQDELTLGGFHRQTDGAGSPLQKAECAGDICGRTGEDHIIEVGERHVQGAAAGLKRGLKRKSKQHGPQRVPLLNTRGRLHDMTVKEQARGLAVAPVRPGGHARDVVTHFAQNLRD